MDEEITEVIDRVLSEAGEAGTEDFVREAARRLLETADRQPQGPRDQV